jgi:hypothetical protein
MAIEHYHCEPIHGLHARVSPENLNPEADKPGRSMRRRQLQNLVATASILETALPPSSNGMRMMFAENTGLMVGGRDLRGSRLTHFGFTKDSNFMDFRVWESWKDPSDEDVRNLLTCGYKLRVKNGLQLHRSSKPTLMTNRPHGTSKAYYPHDRMDNSPSFTGADVSTGKRIGAAELSQVVMTFVSDATAAMLQHYRR